MVEADAPVVHLTVALTHDDRRAARVVVAGGFDGGGAAAVDTTAVAVCTSRVLYRRRDGPDLSSAAFSRERQLFIVTNVLQTTICLE